MKRFRLILLLVLLLPILELLILVRLGRALGSGPVLLYVAATAALGVALVLRPRSILRRAGGRSSAWRGLGDAAALLAAGILFLVPGVISDVLAVLVLVPWTRRALLAALVPRLPLAATSILFRSAPFRRPGEGPPREADRRERPPRPDEFRDAEFQILPEDRRGEAPGDGSRRNRP